MRQARHDAWQVGKRPFVATVSDLALITIPPVLVMNPQRAETNIVVPLPSSSTGDDRIPLRRRAIVAREASCQARRLRPARRS